MQTNNPIIKALKSHTPSPNWEFSQLTYIFVEQIKFLVCAMRPGDEFRRFIERESQ